jgi:hypothetical protein
MIKCVRIISAKDLERHKQHTSNEGKLPSKGRIIESVVEGIQGFKIELGGFLRFNNRIDFETAS